MCKLNHRSQTVAAFLLDFTIIIVALGTEFFPFLANCGPPKAAVPGAAAPIAPLNAGLDRPLHAQ